MSAATEQTNTPKTGASQKTAYTVVPLPKIVFFYPLMFISVFCGIIEAFHEKSHVAGTIFAIFFLINVLVISFDFPGVKALALMFGVMAGIFGIILLDRYIKVLGPIRNVFERLSEQLNASPAFYFTISGILCVMIMGGIMVNVLWNRWTIEPNRLMHTRGLLGDIREYPVIDLQLEKKIDDVFEYLLLLAGTLTFTPNPTTPPIRLENIAFINRAERKIQTIIRKMPPQQ